MPVSPERDAAFRTHLAKLRAKYDARIQSVADEAGDAPVAVWQARDGAMVALHPTTYTEDGDAWQVTRFIAGEIPAGHQVYKTRDKAFKNVADLRDSLGEYRVVHRGVKKNPKRRSRS